MIGNTHAKRLAVPRQPARDNTRTYSCLNLDLFQWAEIPARERSLADGIFTLTPTLQGVAFLVPSGSVMPDSPLT